MQVFSRNALIILSMLVVFGLAACSNAAASNQAQGQPTPQSTTPGSAAQAGQTPTTAATSAPQARIILALDHTWYATNGHIQITITNHLATTIYLSAYYTSCTYITLQRQTQSGWLALGRCLTSATHSVALQPGASVAQQLTPPVANPQMAAHALWPSGTYRATLYYSLSPDSDTTQGNSVTSATFRIG